MDSSQIKKINECITAYFEKNKDTDWIPVKDLMGDLVQNGVFSKDVKKGLPLRKILRTLDKEEKLDSIPRLHAERKDEATYWYFVQEGKTFEPKPTTYRVSEKPKYVKEESDEYYLIGLCNDFLEHKASHQHTFEDLLGDLHKDGFSRTALPIDAYYEELNLAIELTEKAFPEDDVYDKPEKKTISGVNRAAQRKRYAKFKKEYLVKKEIQLVEIDYNLFELDSRYRLVRNLEKDTKIVHNTLKAQYKV